MGQALLARRMGKTPAHRRDRRGPARRGLGHRRRLLRHGVRGLHGRRRHRAPGAERLPHGAARGRGGRRPLRQPHPEGRRQRGHARLGGHGSTTPTTAWARSWAPTPTRGWCGSSSGWWARRPGSSAGVLLDGADPDVVVACVGGGSNAAGTFAGFVDTGRPAGGGGGGRRGGREPRRAGGGARHALATSSRTRSARSARPTRSRPASTTRASGPSTPIWPPPAGPTTAWPPTTRCSTPSLCCRETEGIIPALEPAHALAWVAREAGREIPAGSTVLVTLSGRGDKDVAQVRDLLR